MILASIQSQRVHASKGSHRRDQSRDRNNRDHQDQTNQSRPQARNHPETNISSRSPCNHFKSRAATTRDVRRDPGDPNEPNPPGTALLAELPTTVDIIGIFSSGLANMLGWPCVEARDTRTRRRVLTFEVRGDGLTLGPSVLRGNLGIIASLEGSTPERSYRRSNHALRKER